MAVCFGLALPVAGATSAEAGYAPSPTVVSAGAAPAAAPVRTALAAAAALRCPTGSMPWKVQGRLLCRKRPTASKLPAEQLRAIALLDLVTLKAARGGKAPDTFTSAVAKAAPALLAAAERELWAGAPSISLSTGAVVRLSPWGLPGSARAGDTYVKTVSESQTEKGMTVSVTGRLEVSGVNPDTGQATGSTAPTASLTIGLGFSVADLALKMDMTRIEPYEGRPRCPTVDGKLAWTEGESGALTVLTKKGNRVVFAKTVRSTTTRKVTGQVGDDARLQSVTADSTTATVVSYGTGAGAAVLTVTNASTARVGRTGGGATTGTGSTGVSLKDSGVSAAQAAGIAAQVARDPATSKAATEAAQSAANDIVGVRNRLLKEYEAGWYEAGNSCVRASITPNTSAAPQGTSGTAQATFVRLRDPRVQPRATWKLIQNQRGQLNDGFTSGPGPGTVRWTAEAPDALGITMEGRYEVLSRSGRDVTSLSGQDAGAVDVTVLGELSADSGLVTGSVRVALEYQARLLDDATGAYQPVSPDAVGWRLSDVTITSRMPGCTATVGTYPSLQPVVALGSDATTPVRRNSDGSWTLLVGSVIQIPYSFSGAACPPGEFLFSPSDAVGPSGMNTITVQPNPASSALAGPQTFTNTVAVGPLTSTATLTGSIRPAG